MVVQKKHRFFRKTLRPLTRQQRRKMYFKIHFPSWVRNALSRTQYYVFSERLFWGSDDWIKEDVMNEKWNFFQELPLLNCDEDIKIAYSFSNLSAREGLLKGEKEEILEMLELTETLPLLAFERFFYQAFPYFNKDWLLKQRYPRYLQTFLYFFDNTLIKSWRYDHFNNRLNRLVLRGEYNYQVRTTDSYPTFEFPEDIKCDAVSYFGFEEESLYDFELIYYSMSFFSRKFRHNRLRLNRLWQLFLRVYNLHNRVILRNEWYFFNFPYREFCRRIAAFRGITKFFLYTETYFIFYTASYVIWQRYYRTIFLFYSNSWLLVCRNLFFILLALDWFLSQHYMGDTEWDGHPEVHQPIDYAFEEHANPIDQLFTQNLSLHNDEVGGREFTDMKDTEARYTLFEPEYSLQSDVFEIPRGILYVDDEGLRPTAARRTHWWQQTYSYNWWVWGQSRVFLPKPLNVQTRFSRYAWGGMLEAQKTRLDQLVRPLRMRINSFLFNLVYFRYIIRSIRPQAKFAHPIDVTREESFPLFNYERPWEYITPFDGRLAFLATSKKPNVFRWLKRATWQRTAYLLFWYSNSRRPEGPYKFPVGYTIPPFWR
jgi:hypothetical protein